MQVQNKIAQDYLSGTKKPPPMKLLIHKEIAHFYEPRPLEKGVKVKPPEPQVFAGSYDEMA